MAGYGAPNNDTRFFDPLADASHGKPRCLTETDRAARDLAQANRRLQYEIEHRIEVEQALRESEQRFRQMADHFQEVVWMIDWTQNRPVYISPAYEALAGRSREGMYGDLGDWFDAIHPDDRERVRQAFEEHATDGAFDMTYRLVRPDESVRWVHDRGYPIRDERGQIYRIAGIAVDITDRKLAEERARVLEGQLTHLSRLGTVGEMTSGLAHELNQPLAAIMNYTEACMAMLDSKSYDADALRHAMSCVAELTMRAGRIIEGVRDLVRREQPNRAAVNVRDLILEIVSLAKTQLRMHTIHLRLDLPSADVRVVVEPVQIQQVLLNLISNAVDAMSATPEAHRELTIAAEPQVDGRMTIRVSDTGPGIERECLDDVFDPFSTSKPNGIGMGLTISRTIVESHGGNLIPTNRADGGATFCFDVPVDVTGDQP